MKLTPDQIIDKRYKILNRLGQGGMGEVWKAVDEQLGDEVVIKIPLTNSDPVVLQRFAIEAQMMLPQRIDTDWKSHPICNGIAGLGKEVFRNFGFFWKVVGRRALSYAKGLF